MSEQAIFRDIILSFIKESATPVWGEEIESSLRAFVDAVPFYVFFVDEGHRILFANKATAQALGVDPKAIIGEYCPKAIHGISNPFPGCPLEEALEHGGRDTEKELFEAKGPFWLLSGIYATPLKTRTGRAVFLHMTRDITAKKNVEDRLRRQSDTQNVVGQILRMSLENIPLETLLQRVIDLVLTIPWLAFESRGAILLVGDEPNALDLKVWSRLDEAIRQACRRVPFGRCMCGLAASTRTVQFSSDLDDRHIVRYPGIVPHGHYCVPIAVKDVTLGVLNIYTRPGHSRTPAEEEFLLAVANVLAGVIEHRRAEDRERAAIHGVLEAVEATTESRDPYTAGHQKRAAELAVAIGREIGLSLEGLEGLRFAASIHDIGKIGIPVEILTKPGRLTETERLYIQTHVKTAFDILRNIRFPWPIAEIIYQHHERMDGSGYPRKLSGPELLIEARILAVADVVEAMSSDRPYRPGLGIEAALKHIVENKGVAFDEEAVNACLKLFRERRFVWEGRPL